MPDQPMEERIREALAKHGDWGYLIQSNEMFCKGCEWVKQLFLNEKSADRFREHQAAIVAGIVREAQAKVLEAAATELAQLPYVRPCAPERQEYERLLAIRRGNTDAWLRARAEKIRTNGKGA